MKFDQQDGRIFAALDPEFTISADNEVATITDCKIEIVRIANDKLELTVKFTDMDFPILLSRAKTLEQLAVEADKS